VIWLVEVPDDEAERAFDFETAAWILRAFVFVCVTLALTWLWEEGGRVGAFRQRYVNFVPFVGLVVATPGLPLRRRLLGLAAGIFLLFVGHLALNLTEVGEGRSRHLSLLPSLVSDTLPFVLWLWVAAPALSERWLASPTAIARDSTPTD
jgi:hypothetical protein